MNECLVCADIGCRDCPECVARVQDAEFDRLSTALQNFQQAERLVSAVEKLYRSVELARLQGQVRADVDRAHGDLARHRAAWRQ